MFSLMLASAGCSEAGPSPRSESERQAEARRNAARSAEIRQTPAPRQRLDAASESDAGALLEPHAPAVAPSGPETDTLAAKREQDAEKPAEDASLSEDAEVMDAGQPDAANELDAESERDAQQSDAELDAELTFDGDTELVADGAADASDADRSVSDAEIADAESADAAPPREPIWLTTWGTAVVNNDLSALYHPFLRVTLRQIVRTSVGGERVRVRLSNHFGREPLRIGAAHIALQSEGSSIVEETDRALTFGDAGTVSIGKGQTVTSDPVTLALPPLSSVAISLYLPKKTVAQNSHRESAQTNYASSPGNFVGAVDLPAGSAITSWFFLSGMDVETTAASGTVVTFGDSITDGFGSSLDLSKRWPDELARHLLESGRPLGLANEGYSGNQLLIAGAGEAALERFDRDVLGNVGVTRVILTEGINDIGLSNATSEQVIEAIRQLIERAHAAGLEIIGGTLCPFEGSFFYTETREAARHAVNEWIRGSGTFDGIVDFDYALRDPVFPARLYPAYDSGDHLHPSDLGYEVMGTAVDLALLE